MTPSGAPQPFDHQGQRCIAINSPDGGRVVVALQGAQVLSWRTVGGQEIFYLSPSSLTDGHSAIRGGVPICFPQFNLRALGTPALPKHGFARNLTWTPLPNRETADAVEAVLALSSSDATLALWPHDFQASVTVRLQARRLEISVEVCNTGAEAWSFALALHSYLQVSDVASTTLCGLEGVRYHDAAASSAQAGQEVVQPAGPLTFGAETDRIYANAPATLELRHTAGTLRLSQSANLPDTVVWNPGAELGAAFKDMPADDWQRMVCVEAARINEPQRLAPGKCWRGWQAFEPL